MMTGNTAWKSETNNTVLTTPRLHLTYYYNINYVTFLISVRNCLALPLVLMLHMGVALESVKSCDVLETVNLILHTISHLLNSSLLLEYQLSKKKNPLLARANLNNAA
jgi:hypothetical protein